MSEIDAPSNIPLQTGEGATRVTRTSTTSDDSSAQQQSTDQKTRDPEKAQETKEQPAIHETAVTISTSLSNLVAGSQITASYQGIDGQKRPLIISETGTYVVKFDASHQQAMDKIPQGASLEIKILKVGRDIEARLITHNPEALKAAKAPLSIPVTLELTGLGNAPPQIRATADPGKPPHDTAQISYQASELYRAENIARESANKLKELPLPATTTNYTLYEKAVPQHARPAIIRTAIAGNALIAQEQVAKDQIAKAAPTAPQTPIEAMAKIKTDANVINVEKLLHKNILATVIRNIPKVAVDLPEIVRKHLGATTPLDNLKAGGNFTLRIDSIAVPQTHPVESVPARKADQTTPGNQLKQAITTEAVKNQPQADPAVTKSKPDMPLPSPPRVQEPVAAPPLGLSGIIIAPGQHILKNADKSVSSPTQPLPVNSQYPDRYNPSSYARPTRDSGFVTLYVATPVSVIKIQSPIELTPGTVINFSVSPPPERQVSQQTEAAASEQKTENKPDVKEVSTESQVKQPVENQTAAWTATSLGTPPAAPVAAPLMELPPQPLENIVRNWQSLNQILSVMPVVDSSSQTHLTLNNRLPGVQNPGQMTSGMMFFLAALGAKNPATIWLGPQVTAQLEKAGQGKLLNLLNNDMRRIFRLGAETPSNEWRPALVPLQVGGEVNAIPMLTRQVPDEGDDKKNNASDGEDNDKNAATRFIVELDLTQFGQIQVDGLLKEQKLNIIIRSKIILPSAMKQKMTGLFTTALEISGFAGDLQFRDNMQPDISVQNIVNQKIHMFRS